MPEGLPRSDLKNSTTVLQAHLKDDAFREIWDRTALARAVALRLLAYRNEHRLSQTELAQMLGMQQPAVARLEAGERNPTWETIIRLSTALGIEIQVNIAPDKRRRLIAKDLRREAAVVESSGDGRIIVALG